MTAHAPVFSPFFTWYTSSSPSRAFAALSCSARLSSPTQPVYTTDFGGRTYYNIPPPKKNPNQICDPPQRGLMNAEKRKRTYSSSSSGVLRGTASDIGHIIVFDFHDFVIAFKIQNKTKSEKMCVSDPRRITWGQLR